MRLDAEPAELLGDVGLERFRGGQIRGTGGVSVFLLREPAPVKGVSLVRVKAKGFIVVGYGPVEATALQVDEPAAAQGKRIVGRNRKDSMQSASAPSSRPAIARPQQRPFQ